MGLAGIGQVLGAGLFVIGQLVGADQQGTEGFGQGLEVPGALAEHVAQGGQLVVGDIGGQTGFFHEGTHQLGQFVQGHLTHEVGVDPLQLGRSKAAAAGLRLVTVEDLMSSSWVKISWSPWDQPRRTR